MSGCCSSTLYGCSSNTFELSGRITVIVILQLFTLIISQLLQVAIATASRNGLGRRHKVGPVFVLHLTVVEIVEV